MEGILAAHEQLEKRGNLTKTIQDVQKTIDLLQAARDSVASDPDTAALTMAKLKQPVKQSFDKLDEDLKEVNKGLNQYSKALDKKFKKNTLPTASTMPLAEQPDLINRAIVMHLLREGKFEVANTLVSQLNEARANEDERTSDRRPRLIEDVGNAMKSWVQDLAYPETWEEEGGMEMGSSSGRERGWLQRKFTEMYHILDALRNQHDLGPAIEWARTHSRELEQRGSKALEYARAVFPTFSSRYVRETSNLLGSLAFSANLEGSPYEALFYNSAAWEEASTSFTREFCGLLGLSEKSPLYTAVTAGGIALPVLEKVERVMAQTRGQWTSVNELPVETPLPTAFRFHSIFVCPVSKEQGTDTNWPMMLPCGHALAKESLELHARGKS
jgi:hypothetical protein